jgi:hypothetical protein
LQEKLDEDVEETSNRLQVHVPSISLTIFHPSLDKKKAKLLSLSSFLQASDELTCSFLSLYLQRALKRLKALNTRMRKSSSCWGIVLSVVAVVICVAVAWVLITI